MTMRSLPPALLAFLTLALPALSHASPQPPLVSSDYEISLIPRHTLFLRQLSNLQTFDSALAGVVAPPITNSGDPQRPFSVDGDTFNDFRSAAERSCDNQFTSCSDVANGRNGKRNANVNGMPSPPAELSGKNGKVKSKRGVEEAFEIERRQNGGITVSECDEQKNACKSAQQNAAVQNFETGLASTNIGPDPDFPDFDLICEG